MTQDLQQLLEKIQRDGVDKAKTEADRLLVETRVQAQAEVESARAEAEKIKAEARLEAESFTRRAEETIRQSARDTVLNVEKAVSTLFSNLLLKEVNAALADTDIVTGLAVAAVHTYLGSQGSVEVSASAKLADALRAKFAAEAVSGVNVITDEATATGFRIRLAGGRVEHTFTGAAVAEALSKQLRPRLAALMKTN
jgi:V/A-type H+-transporting ATPase subunit E